MLPAYNEKEECIFLPASGITTGHGLEPSADQFSDEIPEWYGMDTHQPCSVDVIDSAVESDQSSAQQAEFPTGTNEGSCLCGSLKYRITGGTDAIRGCHCSRCRQRSGASFFSAMPVLFSKFHIDGAEENITSFFLDGSQYYGYSFCNSCGTLIPTIFPDGKRTVIAAGSLDSTPPTGLKYHIYYGSKAPWLNLNEAEKCFEAHPPLDFSWSREQAQ